MSEAYLSLGSNMGDRIDNLSRAVALLDRPSEGVSRCLLSLRQRPSDTRIRTIF